MLTIIPLHDYTSGLTMCSEGLVDAPVKKDEGAHRSSRCTTLDNATSPPASDTYPSLKDDRGVSPITEAWIERTPMGFAKELARITEREAMSGCKPGSLHPAFHQEMSGYLRELATLLIRDKSVPSSIREFIAPPVASWAHRRLSLTNKLPSLQRPYPSRAYLGTFFLSMRV